MSEQLKAPFPYFGGKSQIAARVWELFGSGVRNYVEPFAGSLAVLLGRPTPYVGPETVNDWSCHLVNAWRAIRADPAALAELLIAPVGEVNTEAQHGWIMREADELRNALGDPGYSDTTLAAYWIKGANEWIGSGWAGGGGPWSWTKVDGWRKHSSDNGGSAGTGVNRKLPHLGDAGTGVNRKLPHLGDAGKGVNRQLPHLGDAGKGEYAQRVAWLTGWLMALQDRLCWLRIACGDFERVLGDSSTIKHGTTAVFLDPPYSDTEYVYGTKVPVAQRVNAWCQANEGNPKLRIILAGRGTEHDSLGWAKENWSARRGYADHDKRATECLWLSPSIARRTCLLD